MATPAPFTPVIKRTKVKEFGESSWLALELAEKPAQGDEPAHPYLLLSRGYFKRSADNLPVRTALIPIPLDAKTIDWLRRALKEEKDEAFPQLKRGKAQAALPAE